MSGAADLAGLLLAAGGSARLGQAKQLLEFRGESLVRRGAAMLAGLGLETTVVTGSHRFAVERELRGLPVATVHNGRWREGIGTSVARGARSLADSVAAALILLVDQYAVAPGDLAKLIEAWRAEPGCIAASRWEDACGPPAVFPAAYFRQLGQLEGDTGARVLMARHRESVRYVDIPNAAIDVDNAADLGTLARRDA